MMNLFRKLTTAARGRSYEVTEKQVDRQMLTIFAQEIRDAERSLHQAREALVLQVAERKGLEKQCERLQREQQQAEARGRQALEAGHAQEADRYGERYLYCEAEQARLQGQIEAAQARESQRAEQLRQTSERIQSARWRLARARSQAQAGLDVAGSAGGHTLESALRELQSSEQRLDQLEGRQEDLGAARQVAEDLVDPLAASERRLAEAASRSAREDLLRKWQGDSAGAA